MNSIVILLLFILIPPPVDMDSWASDQILNAASNLEGPFRIVWNQQNTTPVGVEQTLLSKGLALSAAMDAARIEITYHELNSKDVDMSIRVLDRDGVLLRSESASYRAPRSGFRRMMNRIGTPLLVTAATGITVYLLYNVRSR